MLLGKIILYKLLMQEHGILGWWLIMKLSRLQLE